MSTQFTTPSPFQAVIDSEIQCRPSFGGLVEKLESLTELPALELLQSWLGDAAVPESDVEPYRIFKAGTYARHRVMRNQFVELLVLCWRPGQRTPIHDHNGSVGAVRVYEGVLWETLFSLDEEGVLRYDIAREWRPDNVTGATVPDIHQLGNSDVSGLDMVTFHIYSPPLSVLNTYKVGSAQIDQYSPDLYTDGAGI